jgi:hypothetical protein
VIETSPSPLYLSGGRAEDNNFPIGHRPPHQLRSPPNPPGHRIHTGDGGFFPPPLPTAHLQRRPHPEMVVSPIFRLRDLPSPPHSRYHGVRQREWGTWEAQITDCNTGRRICLGTFQLAAQATWRHDVENVRLHGSDCDELNFMLCSEEPVLELFAPPHRGGVIRPIFITIIYHNLLLFIDIIHI